MASAAAADLPGPHHEADWGELSEESDREEDPVLEPELPSGSGKRRRSESSGKERELRPERELLPERGQPAVHPGGPDPEGWQLPVSAQRRVQDPESLLLQRPQEPLPELPEEVPELNLQLELSELPLPPYLLPGEEESGELPQVHDRDLPALQDGREDEGSEREEGRGRKRKRSKERRKKDREERRRKKEKKRERKGKRGPRKLLAILDKIRIRPTRRAPRPKVQIQPRTKAKEGMAKASAKAKASPEPKPKPRVEMDLRIPITPPVVRSGESLEQQRRNFEMWQQAETNRLRRLSTYVAAVASTAAKLPLPQPEESAKESTKRAPERVQPEERKKTKLEENMEKDKRDLGDLRVYRRRRQGKYAQESEEEDEPPRGVIQGTYRSVQKGKAEEPGKGKEGKGKEEEEKSSDKGKKGKGKDKGKSKGKKGKNKDKGKKGKGKPKEMKERKRKEKEKIEVQRKERQEGLYTWRCRMMKNGALGGSPKEEGASLQRVKRCQSHPQRSQQSLQSHQRRSQQSLQRQRQRVQHRRVPTTARYGADHATSACGKGSCDSPSSEEGCGTEVKATLALPAGRAGRALHQC